MSVPATCPAYEDAELLAQRPGDGAVGFLAPLAVEEDVDALVPERHQASDHDGVGQRLLVAPGDVLAPAPTGVERPVRRVALVGAAAPPWT
jgi:hypothetical protein